MLQSFAPLLTLGLLITAISSLGDLSGQWNTPSEATTWSPPSDAQSIDPHETPAVGQHDRHSAHSLQNPIGSENDNLYSDFTVTSSNTEAAYAIEFGQTSAADPVGIYLFTATGTSSRLSETVTGTGDVNNDGLDDYLVTSSSFYIPERSTNHGVVFVLFGNRNRTAVVNIDLNAFTAGERGYRVIGDTTPMGFFLSGGGDINSDGIADFAAGAPHYSGTGGGVVFVVFGKTGMRSDIDLSTWTVGIDGFKINHTAYSELGFAVSMPGGSVNCDGVDDLVVGARSIDKVYVLFGGARSFTDVILDSPNAHVLLIDGTGSSASGGLLGHGVAIAQDINGDNCTDLIFSAVTGMPPAASSFYGVVYAMYGSISLVGGTTFSLGNWVTSSSFGFRVYGPDAFSHLGAVLSTAGDVNNDGFGDFLVGTYVEGTAHLVFGSDNRVSDVALSAHNLTDSLTFRGIDSTVDFGAVVSRAGDFNGDGVDDIVISAHKLAIDGSLDVGAAFILYGGYLGDGNVTEILSSGGGVTVRGSTANNEAAFAVGFAGDVDGDGGDDVIFGSPDVQNAAYVLYGPLTSPPTISPSVKPSVRPTAQPSQPTSQPSSCPSMQPTSVPSTRPSALPSCLPTSCPTTQPSCMPSSQPSSRPSCVPSSCPSVEPTVVPTTLPSALPSEQPSAQPSGIPSSLPTARPTLQPSSQPTCLPSSFPTTRPTTQPSSQPTSCPSGRPSERPSALPSAQPTGQPSSRPSTQPSIRPSSQPSRTPTGQPTSWPSVEPSQQPLSVPTAQPTSGPTHKPTPAPTCSPTLSPSAAPTLVPSAAPSTDPSAVPTTSPSCNPTAVPSATPTAVPSTAPTELPSLSPSLPPSCMPTAPPTEVPTCAPTTAPSCAPTLPPSASPSRAPSAVPTLVPTTEPTVAPTLVPTLAPSASPSACPTAVPTLSPTSTPAPTAVPTVTPSASPSVEPTMPPTLSPTRSPTCAPTRRPSASPSARPTLSPTIAPTLGVGKTSEPSRAPTPEPTLSEADTWRKKLADLERGTAQEQPATTVHYTSYSELVVQSSSDNPIVGGCTAWRTLLSGDLDASLLLYMPLQLQLTVLESINTNSKVVCSDKTVVRNILTALARNGSTSNPFVCGSDTWKVARCAPSKLPAICVGCSDPCAVDAHCSTSGSAPSNSPLLLAPCGTITCPSGSTLVTAARHLTVAFGEQEPAPEILSQSTVSTSSSLTVTSKLSGPGTIYCAAYWVDPNAEVAPSPSSPTSIILANLVSATDRYNETVVTVANLASAADFRLFCMTASRTGALQNFSQVLAQQVVAATTCCIPVTVQPISASAKVSANVRDFLSIVVNTRPSADIDISITLYEAGGAAVQTAPFFPASFKIKALAESTALYGVKGSTTAAGTLTKIQTVTMTSSLQAVLPVGTYTYEVTVSGASMSQFTVVYANPARTITIIPVVSPLPAPVLLSATFADDGSYVAIAFDSVTDKGKGATQLPCSQLFSFACAAQSSCVWVSGSQVNAYISTTTVCAAVGSPITLAANAVVKALCQVSSCDTTSWPTASTTTQVNIVAPLSAVAPVVAISAPSTVGACDTITVDISGSSGNGRRPWSSRELTVETTAVRNVTDLQYFLTNTYRDAPPTPIPAALLSKGNAYTFVVKLCNFLGKCSQSSKRVLVQDKSIPTVTLPGGALRSTQRFSQLVVSSDAFVAGCATGSRSTAGLTYAWSVSTGGVPLSVTSLSKDPTRLRLPEYVLAVGIVYAVTLRVTVSATLVSSTASIRVVVVPGNLVAVAAQGTSRTVQVGQQLTIDGSGSYDEDVEGVTGRAAGLLFSWACAQTEPSFSPNCTKVFSNVSDSLDSAKHVVIARADADGRIAQITMYVLDQAYTRSTQIVVTVKVVPSLSPVVVLSSNAQSTGNINGNVPLQLSGRITLPARYAATASWSVDDTSNFVLAAAALSPVSVRLPASISPQVLPIYMVIAANTLPDRAVLSFKLTTQLAGVDLAAVATVTVTVNAPPLPGLFSITPVNGTEIETQFTFVASQWYDADLPLQYQFGYLANSGADMTLRSKAEVAYATAALTAGIPGADFVVMGTLTVLDTLTATSTASHSVKVFKQVERDNAAVIALVSNALNGTSVDALKQATVFGSYLLNEVNCTMAPNCTALNRKDCYRTAHTCGECLSSVFIGDAGDSNQPCIPSSLLDVGASGGPCITSQDCSGFEACISSKCSRVPKPCAGNCSYPNGVCVMIEASSGDPVKQCYVGDSTCSAVCQCNEQYATSETCSANQTEVLRRQALRSQVIQGVQAVIDREYPDAKTVADWVSSLTAASQVPSELSEDSTTTLLEAAGAVLSGATQAGLAPDSITSLMSTLDAVMTVRAARVAQQVRRLRTAVDREASRRLSESNILDGMNLTSQFTQFALDGLLPGQRPIETSHSQFRILVQKLALLETKVGGITTVTVSTPRSQLERATGQLASQVLLPVQKSANASAVQVALTSLRSQLYHSELRLQNTSQVFSNPLTVDLAGLPCGARDTCTVDLVLPVTAALKEYAKTRSEDVIFSTFCDVGERSNHTYTCPDGTTLNATCDGKWPPREVTGRCPVTSYQRVCNAFSGLTEEDPGCSVKKVSDTSITCTCPVHVISRRRRLMTTNEDSGEPEASVSYVAMLESTKTSFSNNVESVQGYDAQTAKNGWSVIVTLGVFTFVAAVAMAWSFSADGKAAATVAVVAVPAAPVPSSPSRSWNGSDRLKFLSQFSLSKNSAGSQSRDSVGDAENLDAGAEAGPGVGAGAGAGAGAEAGVSSQKVNAELLMFEQALPPILTQESLLHRVTGELKKHHKWLGVVYHFSPHFPRPLRVLSLVTNVVIMLFVQSLTYQFTNPDDGSCREQHDKDACLKAPSAYERHAHKCYWDASEKYYPCKFVQPDSDEKVILFVAILSAMVATPVALLVEYMIMSVLTAPTKEDDPTATADAAAEGAQPDSAVDLVAVEKGLPASSVPTTPTKQAKGELEEGSSTKSIPRTRSNMFGSFFQSMFGTSSKAAAMSSLVELRAEHDLKELSAGLAAYRATLNSNARNEFDALWGLDARGRFASNKTLRSESWRKAQSMWQWITQTATEATATSTAVKEVADRVLEDLKKVHARLIVEAQQDADLERTDFEKGRHLLYLFHRDLLPGLSGEILEAKAAREGKSMQPVSWSVKAVCWAFIAALDMGMLAYILIFALNQTVHRQGAWALSFALWLVVEILFVSSATVVLMHVLVPSLIVDDVRKVRQKLADTIRSFTSAASSAVSKRAPDSQFDAAKYLFVSKRLAEQWPELKESEILARFRTPWPKHSYKRERKVSSNYSDRFREVYRGLSVVGLFFITNLVHIPPMPQDVLTQIGATAAVGALVLLHIELYRMSPALVVLPTLALGVLIALSVCTCSSYSQISRVEMYRDIDELNREEEVHQLQDEDFEAPPRPGLVRGASRKQSMDDGVRTLKSLHRAVSNRQIALNDLDQEQDSDTEKPSLTTKVKKSSSKKKKKSKKAVVEQKEEQKNSSDSENSDRGGEDPVAPAPAPLPTVAPDNGADEAQELPIQDTFANFPKPSPGQAVAREVSLSQKYGLQVRHGPPVAAGYRAPEPQPLSVEPAAAEAAKVVPVSSGLGAYVDQDTMAAAPIYENPHAKVQDYLTTLYQRKSGPAVSGSTKSTRGAASPSASSRHPLGAAISPSSRAHTTQSPGQSSQRSGLLLEGTTAAAATASPHTLAASPSHSSRSGTPAFYSQRQMRQLHQRSTDLSQRSYYGDSQASLPLSQRYAAVRDGNYGGGNGSEGGGDFSDND